jgi:sterol desaturase/sphingolipid hydroxylase (fatty acid hydroxylase superfamily)
MLQTLLSQWQPFLAVFVLLLFLMWESVAPFFPRRKRLRHATRNLTIAVLNAIVLAFVFASLTVLVADASQRHQWGLLRWLGLSGVALNVVAFGAFDMWMYWWHRLNHLVPFLWRFHRMHHSDPEMDVTTATRFHLGEITLSSLLRLLLIPLLGIPIEVLILFDVVQLPIISFHHANISLPDRVDKALKWFIVTPFMHKVHHSRIKPETDSNFSSLLSVWDRLFGSFVEKERYDQITFGLDQFDDEERQTVKGLLLTPFVRS